MFAFSVRETACIEHGAGFYDSVKCKCCETGYQYHWLTNFFATFKTVVYVLFKWGVCFICTSPFPHPSASQNLLQSPRTVRLLQIPMQSLPFNAIFTSFYLSGRFVGKFCCIVHLWSCNVVSPLDRHRVIYQTHHTRSSMLLICRYISSCPVASLYLAKSFSFFHYCFSNFFRLFFFF